MAVTRISQSSLKQGLKKNKNFVAGLTAISGEFDSIQTITVGVGGQAAIEFTSIPQNYRHLQLRIVGKTSVSVISSIYLRFNNDVGSNYTQHYLYTDGSTTASGGSGLTNLTLCGTVTGNFTNVFGASVVDILDYTSTIKPKSMKSFSGVDTNGGGYIQLFSGAWNNSASPITSLILTNASNPWQQYTTAALYGIKAS